jgi:hypothetical protein
MSLIALLIMLLVPIDVPTGNGNPVLIDGTFSPGEWSDAREVAITDSVRLYVKEFRGHVFIGLRTPRSMLAYTDLFFQGSDGVAYNIHASSQLGERRMTDTLFSDTVPAHRWGYTDGWYANEMRTDRALAQRLLTENPQRDRGAMLFETTYPMDGFEYQIKRSKFPGREWRVRIEARTGVAGLSDVVYPRDSSRRRPDSWAILRFSR